jgi:hypothetical protein
MAKLEGTIALGGLPTHRGLVVHLCFFPVGTADAPAPPISDPLGWADHHEVAKLVYPHTESSQSVYNLPFTIERPGGFYYLQVHASLLRDHAGKLCAQVEQFIFGGDSGPLALIDGRMTMPLLWPATPLDELDTWGVIEPGDYKPDGPPAAPDPATESVCVRSPAVRVRSWCRGRAS